MTTSRLVKDHFNNVQGFLDAREELFAVKDVKIRR